MTRIAQSNQIRHLIVGLVFVVVMHTQAMGAVMSAGANPALEAVPFAHLVFQPSRELFPVWSDGCAVFPSWGIRSTEEFPRASLATEDAPRNHGWRSNYSRSAVPARVALSKPWANTHFFRIAALIRSFAFSGAEQSLVSLRLRCLPQKRSAAFRAVNGAHAASALGLRARITTCRVGSLLENARLNQELFPAVSAVDLSELHGALVGTPASVIAEPATRPHLFERLLALRASGHTSIFSRGLNNASTVRPTG